MPAIGDILAGKGICICGGSGGVGKTTTSAAIATGMAAGGLKVCVLTIDPAKRLADSLGLKELGNEARRVDPKLFESQGIEMKGELWAMMLDAKATFDELVARQAPDEESRDRVLGNRIYQQVSSALAGSQEYMAMEKLFELHTEGRFDLLVLDTPPTRNALDFLDAPRRLTQFIEGRSLRVFMRPTGLAARVAGRGASVALSVFKRIVGFDLIADLAEFFNAFSGMVDGFQARAKRVNGLLADPRTCFLVVCGPQGEPIDEAVYFHRKLVEAKLPFGGVIVNKVHYPAEKLRGDGAALLATLTEKLGDEDLAGRVADNFADYQALAERDARNIKRLASELRTKAVIRVPYLDEDVHDLAGLAEINRYLFATAEERIELAAGRAADQADQGRRERGVLRTRATEDADMRRSTGVAVMVVLEFADLPVRVLGHREEVTHARRVDPLAMLDLTLDGREVERARLHLDRDLVQPRGGGDLDLAFGGNRLHDPCFLLHVVLLEWDLVCDCGHLRAFSGLHRHCYLGVSRFETRGDQGVFGGGGDVGADLAESGVAQHDPHSALDPVRQLGVVGTPWCRSSASAPARGRARPARAPESGRASRRRSAPRRASAARRRPVRGRRAPSAAPAGGRSSPPARWRAHSPSRSGRPPRRGRRRDRVGPPGRRRARSAQPPPPRSAHTRRGGSRGRRWRGAATDRPRWGRTRGDRARRRPA